MAKHGHQEKRHTNARMNDKICKSARAASNQENNFSNHQAGEQIPLGWFQFFSAY